MGDPLSISASVAGLVSLGLQTTEYLYKYYTAYRDRDVDLAKTAEKLGELLQTLSIIEDIVQTRTWRPSEYTVLRHIESSITHCDEVIQELQDEARKCRNEPDDTLKGKIKDAGRRAAYPFRRSTLVKLDEDVNELRDNLSIALQALGLKDQRDTQDSIEEIKKIIKYAQAQHLAASLRGWLKAADASIDFNAACAKRYADTGQWFAQSDGFKMWLRQENSFRWLYGFAGCGKSVLCATAIQHTFRHQQSHAGDAVAFFFFTFTDEAKQDASAMLRALLSQLSGQVDGLDADLAQLRESYNHGTPPVPVLVEYLRQAVKRSRDVYILLDALDESPIDTSREELLAVLGTMHQWLLPGLHLLVTSRDVLDVRDGLLCLSHDRDQEHIALKNDSVREDIRRYVSYRVDHDPQLRRWDSHRETIKKYLTQNADGVFRWVDCQLGPLRQCPQSVRHLEKCLSRLPPSLDATYERMLCGINEDSRDDARRILSLLFLAARPLYVSEVIGALAVDVNDLECYDINRELESADDLSRICPGLIEIIDSREYDKNDSDGKYHRLMESQIVRIAHFSVQEYLVSDRIQRSLAKSFRVSGSLQHSQISKTCMLYLCHNDFLQQTLSPDLIEQYPLAQFAARYWYYHYRQIDDQSAQELTDRAVVLITPVATRERWVRLHDPHQQSDMRPLYDEVEDLGSPIYYASLLGLDRVVQAILLESQPDVNARGGHYGNALQAASVNGHEKVVQILLGVGANVNGQGGGFYGNALQAASDHGREGVVRILLKAGADVNAQGGGFYDNALQAASDRGRERVVQILLEAGADVNAQGGRFYGNALQAASDRGREKVVQILLDAGADVNAQGGNFYDNALHTASYRGYKKVVQILLKAGADANTRGGPYENALQAAAYRGYDRVVQILIKEGADVNAQGGPYQNALQAAAYRGHLKVVQTLLKAGADVNLRGGPYENALQAALVRDHKDVVQLLLEAGAEAPVIE